MRELFVYYRVAAEDASRCEAVVREFQARLGRDEPCLRARLLVRPETHDGAMTWMETYAVDGASTEGVDAALEARIEAAASDLAPLLRSARHVEVFMPRA